MNKLEIRVYQADDEAAVIRLWQQCGLVVPWNDPRADIKRKLTAQMKREGVRILNRVMVTALLTDGAGVVGAAGFHVRAGEFLAFGAKSVVLATGRAIR